MGSNLQVGLAHLLIYIISTSFSSELKLTHYTQTLPAQNITTEVDLSHLNGEIVVDGIEAELCSLCYTSVNNAMR